MLFAKLNASSNTFDWNLVATVTWSVSLTMTTPDPAGTRLKVRAKCLTPLGEIGEDAVARLVLSTKTPVKVTQTIAGVARGTSKEKESRSCRVLGSSKHRNLATSARPWIRRRSRWPAALCFIKFRDEDRYLSSPVSPWPVEPKRQLSNKINIKTSNP